MSYELFVLDELQVGSCILESCPPPQLEHTSCAPEQGRRNWGGGGGGQRCSCPSNFGEILTLALDDAMDKNELKVALAPPTLEHFLCPSKTVKNCNVKINDIFPKVNYFL